MKLFFTALFLFTLSTSLVQNAGPIVTEEQNIQWLQEMKRLQLEEKLDMMKGRWMADTVAVIEPVMPHKKASAKTISSKSRPVYIFIKEKEGQINFPPNPTAGVIAEVSKMLIPENISEVNIETGKLTALYGVRGLGGVVFIVVAEDFNFRKLKELLIR